MAVPHDLMTKANTPSGLTSARPSRTERRGSRRCKITQLMRIRPSDPEREMRLFVTMPYTKEPSAMSHEYLAEVVRRDHLPNGLFGVGFKILMEMGLHSNFSGYSIYRK